MNRSVFGSAFDRVVVINLDRRADRMSSLRDQLNLLEIGYTRHSATDGKALSVAREWQDYMRTPSAVPDSTRPVTDWRDFYLGDKPRNSRVAFFESERNERAISTPGAWGLFRSMTGVIEKALKDNVESLLILEDDVRFHRDTVEIWPKVYSELPTNWQVFQLGAMQLHWEDDWINWHSQHLYKCQGSSIAAHAVALKNEAMRAVLERSNQPDLPFDIGALQEVKRLFQDRCFTAYPNLAIQDTQDSEIGMSKIFEREAKKLDNAYRWNWADYKPTDLRPFNTFSKTMNKINSANTPPTSEVTYLQPYSAAPGSADRVIVVFGPENTETASAFIAMLKQQKDSGEIAPIVLIDDMIHIPLLREAELAFEYVPTPETYDKVLGPFRDTRIMVERRLSIIRRKWLPRRIIALGPNSHARLETWRSSPFEQADLGPDLVSDEDLFREIE